MAGSVYGKCKYCHAVLAAAADVREHAQLHNYEHEGRPLNDEDTPLALDGLLYDSDLVDAFKALDERGALADTVEPFEFGGGGGFSGRGASGVTGDQADTLAQVEDSAPTTDELAQAGAGAVVEEPVVEEPGQLDSSDDSPAEAETSSESSDEAGSGSSE